MKEDSEGATGEKGDAKEEGGDDEGETGGIKLVRKKKKKDS